MNEFDTALKAAELDMGGKGIGTMGEKTLHLALKYYFAPDPETHERPVGGFIADAVTEECVVEIQTRGFSRLKPKRTGGSYDQEDCRDLVYYYRNSRFVQ